MTAMMRGMLLCGCLMLVVSGYACGDTLSATRIAAGATDTPVLALRCADPPPTSDAISAMLQGYGFNPTAVVGPDRIGFFVAYGQPPADPLLLCRKLRADGRVLIAQRLMPVTEAMGKLGGRITEVNAQVSLLLQDTAAREALRQSVAAMTACDWADPRWTLLGTLGTEQDVVLVQDMLKRHPHDAPMVAGCHHALVLLQGDAHAAVLAEEFNSITDSARKELLAYVMGGFPAPETVAALRACVADAGQSDQMRMVAAQGLATQGDTACLLFLRTMAARGPQARRHEFGKVLLALGSVGTASDSATLNTYLASRELEIQRAVNSAAFMLRLRAMPVEEQIDWLGRLAVGEHPCLEVDPYLAEWAKYRLRYSTHPAAAAMRAKLLVDSCVWDSTPPGRLGHLEASHEIVAQLAIARHLGLAALANVPAASPAVAAPAVPAGAAIKLRLSDEATGQPLADAVVVHQLGNSAPGFAVSFTGADGAISIPVAADLPMVTSGIYVHPHGHAGFYAKLGDSQMFVSEWYGTARRDDRFSLPADRAQPLEIKLARIDDQPQPWFGVLDKHCQEMMYVSFQRQPRYRQVVTQYIADDEWQRWFEWLQAEYAALTQRYPDCAGVAVPPDSPAAQERANVIRSFMRNGFRVDFRQ